MHTKPFIWAIIVLFAIGAIPALSYENTAVKTTSSGDIVQVNIKDASYFEILFGGLFSQQSVVIEPSETVKPSTTAKVKVYDAFNCYARAKTAKIQLTKPDGSFVWQESVLTQVNDLIRAKCAPLGYPNEKFFGVIEMTFTTPASGNYVVSYRFEIDDGTVLRDSVPLVVTSTPVTECQKQSPTKEIYKSIDGGTVYKITTSTPTLTNGQCIYAKDTDLVTECGTGFEYGERDTANSYTLCQEINGETEETMGFVWLIMGSRCHLASPETDVLSYPDQESCELSRIASEDERINNVVRDEEGKVVECSTDSDCPENADCENVINDDFMCVESNKGISAWAVIGVLTLFIGAVAIVIYLARKKR